ncbi:hypothetical protein KC19_8G050500 [Ceratodon purpureus]|uniref:Uncharacterized protein n=1 Tax=Ceratodon purpureus TaxID=3225 RepID=A0A8T0H0U5_CERPU|nr:hypothetical protein KC19_8G050500 [Ceratodon purpureus]
MHRWLRIGCFSVWCLFSYPSRLLSLLCLELCDVLRFAIGVEVGKCNS